MRIVRPLCGPDPRHSLSRDHVHDPLADVHRMVRDPLEIAGDEDVPGPDFDVQGAGLHLVHELLEGPVLEQIHRVIVFLDVADRFRVPRDERADRLVHEPNREFRHLRDAPEVPEVVRLLPPEFQRDLRDVLRVPPDPVEVRRDLEGGCDRPQVPGDGRVEGDQVDAVLLDLDLEGVDLAVQEEHLVRDGGVEAGEPVHRLPDRELAEVREGDHVLVQGLEPHRKRLPFRLLGHDPNFFGHYPNLPVMYFSVSSSAGRSKSSRVTLYSMSLPRYRNAVLSATRAAGCMLWVTMTTIYSFLRS